MRNLTTEEEYKIKKSLDNYANELAEAITIEQIMSDKDYKYLENFHQHHESEGIPLHTAEEMQDPKIRLTQANDIIGNCLPPVEDALRWFAEGTHNKQQFYEHLHRISSHPDREDEHTRNEIKKKLCDRCKELVEYKQTAAEKVSRRRATSQNFGLH